MTLKNVTKENLVDMAWKTEGLPELLRKNERDGEAASLERAQVEALCIAVEEAGTLPQEWMDLVYQAMEVSADKYNYDSGKRQLMEDK